MFKNPNEQVWQFPVQNNRSRFADEGLSFFKVRSTQKAAKVGHRLKAIKDVKLERLRNNVWMVNGIVVLESPVADSADQSSFFEPRATI
jgi:hypothetical protein